MVCALALVAAYLLGSIPFSFLVARAFGVADVRQVGSGNVGASNVLRSAGKAAGVLALLLDVAKGVVAPLLAAHVLPDQPTVAALAAVAAVLGHMYPLWLRFLGSSSPKQIASLRPALVAAAAACGPARARVADLGTFPQRGRPRVLWLGIALPQPVLDLQAACEEAAVAAGFPPEARPFRSH
ncbi:MAG: glycerol-3-phosphate acyltransferase, partial [Vicinamibacteria bacterium]